MISLVVLWTLGAIMSPTAPPRQTSRGRPLPAVPPSPLALARLRARKAHALAKRADPISGALFDRWYSDCVLFAGDQPQARAAEMYRRIAIALEIAADRTTWGRGVMR